MPEQEYHRISPSELSQYRKCRRLWHFTDQLRLEPIAPTQALDTGTAGHKAMEVYYNPQDFRIIPHSARVEQAIGVFQSEMISQRRKYEAEGYELNEDQEAAWDKDFERVTGALRHYFEFAHEHDDFIPLHVEYKINTPLLAHYIPPGGWLPVLCPCHGWPIHLTGKIDLVKLMPDGSIRVVDWKFVGSHKDNTTYLTLDEQMSLYLLGYQKQEQVQVAGVDYVEILKDYPKPPPQIKGSKAEPIKFSVNKENATTYALFRAELTKYGLDPSRYVDYLEYLVHNRGSDFWFRTTPVERSQKELQLIQERTIAQVQEMLNNPPIYPDPTVFKCGYCSFVGPCQAMNEGSDYELMLKENYRPKKSIRDTPTPNPEEVPF